MKKIYTLSIFIFAVLSMFALVFILANIEKKAPLTGSSFSLTMPVPIEGEENEKLREGYNKLRHRTAPGLDWKKIEEENVLATHQNLLSQTGNTGSRITETFAGGAISGDWSEKGAANQAGSIRCIDYLPVTNTLYTISNGGSIWKSTLESGNWEVLNQGFRFDLHAIKAFTKTTGGTRLLAAIGLNLMYSDNEGISFTAVTGINFPVAWEGNFVANIIKLNDASNTIYCLTRPWSSSPWGSALWLYRSTDQGQSFIKIREFATGNDNLLSICTPYNSTDLYVVDAASIPGSIVTSSISGDIISPIGTNSLGVTISSCLLKATKIAGITTMYLLVNNDRLYRSTNNGVSWEFRSTLPEVAWNKMNVSMNNADIVSYGGQSAYRSSDGASTFTKVNSWGEYYSNVPAKLHADIMEIEYFKKLDNTEFAIVNCHGGTYLSYDKLVTVANQSLVSHRATEYYDVITDMLNPNRIFVGTQDQGLQRTLTGNTAGIQNFTQVISGDYGHLCLTANNQFLWAQYPGGAYYLYKDLGNVSGPSYIGTWSMSGTQKPNYGWMLPAISTTTQAANEIWIGGGNITGGGGSFLTKLSMSTTSPFTVTPTQLAYDFRANSNTGTAGITAIEQSPLNNNRLFVATEDGTFFYSSDLGVTWTKSIAFTGPAPWYLYGSCIVASRKNTNVLWYAGSGYSNAPVFKSVDGGVSFTSMSVGLPPTLVNKIVSTPGEDFLFAATEAGPFVYVAASNQWYPLISNSTPIQFYTSVEYISSEKTVRFGTFGRGIWDFKITSAILPISLLSFNADYKMDNAFLSWNTANENNSSHFDIERSEDAVHFKKIGSVIAAGFSTAIKEYSYTDVALSKLFSANGGVAYYRLKIVDKNGEVKLSKIESIKIPGHTVTFALLQNPVNNEAVLLGSGRTTQKVAIKITSTLGKIMLSKIMTAANGETQFKINTAFLSKGIYFIEIIYDNKKQVLKMLKE